MTLDQDSAGSNRGAAVLRDHGPKIPLVADVTLLVDAGRLEDGRQRSDQVSRRNIGEVAARRWCRLSLKLGL